MARKRRSAVPDEETRARFREALERKRQAEHRSTEAAGSDGPVHGPETTGPTQRIFRRKSG
jgi:hypothetical protein